MKERSAHRAAQLMQEELSGSEAAVVVGLYQNIGGTVKPRHVSTFTIKCIENVEEGDPRRQNTISV